MVNAARRSVVVCLCFVHSLIGSNMLLKFVSTKRILSSVKSTILRGHSSASVNSFQLKNYTVLRQIPQPSLFVLTSRLSSFRYFSESVKQEENAKTEEQVDFENEQKEKEKQRARQRKITKYTLFGMISIFSGSLVYAFFNWGAPALDEDGKPIIDEFSDKPFVIQYAQRAWSTFTSIEKTLKEPTRSLLLPPPLPPPYVQPPFTLVLEMTGVLVHPQWTYKTGWRFRKRPFVDYFLHNLATSANFEIVIYTHEQGFTAFPLLNNLDPNGYIMYRLFKDSTRYENGVHKKDLSALNRDLKTVIHIDWDADACSLNPDNCFKLKKWDGNPDDKTLHDLTDFLMAIANERVQDVREVVRYYSQFEDPLAMFRENQRKLAEQEKEAQALKATKSPTYKSLLLDSFRRR